MFYAIFAAWGVGMIGYVLLDKKNKYENLHFYDVRKKVMKYKRLQKNLSEQSKGGLF